jgi:hypothetical protein
MLRGEKLSERKGGSNFACVRWQGRSTYSFSILLALGLFRKYVIINIPTLLQFSCAL